MLLFNVIYSVFMCMYFNIVLCFYVENIYNGKIMTISQRYAALCIPNIFADFFHNFYLLLTKKKCYLLQNTLYNSIVCVCECVLCGIVVYKIMNFCQKLFIYYIVSVKYIAMCFCQC